MNKAIRVYRTLFLLGLAAFTVWAVLDTFAIRRVYAAAEISPAPAAETAEETGSAGTGAAEITADGYRDDAVTIRLREERVGETTVHVAEIRLTDPSALKTAFADGSYGRNVAAAASVTAEEAGAVLAVNGDNYGSRETGYVIRGGVLYRSVPARDQEDLVIWSDGTAAIVRESEITAEELLARGAREVFSFGPGLVDNGEITVGASDEVDRAMASNPRTAVGVLADGTWVFVVSDGRTTESEGLTLYDLAAYMRSLGCVTAYNLDGGGSSTMVFNGAVVNVPSSGRNGGRERAVTDIVYIAG